MKVLIAGHHQQPRSIELAQEAFAWLNQRGHTCGLGESDIDALSASGIPPFVGSPSEADLALCLGGDGTVLRAVRLLAGAPVPILGVNLGNLGYLTEVEGEGLPGALDRFSQGPDLGGWSAEHRMMLAVSARSAQGTDLGSWSVLNEAVVEKRQSGNTVRLTLIIDGSAFTSYAADGLIVSTPTGSTAYSLSARGPIVSPRHRAMLVTPVAPHMLFDRSLVLDPSEVVDIEVTGHRSAALVVDGSTVADLDDGARVTCQPAAHTASFIRFGEHRYHQILKEKFSLFDR